MQLTHPSFGTLLKRSRKAAGLTQEELAERAGLSTKAISALECEIRRPRRYTVEMLAEALNLSEQDRGIFEAVARGQFRQEAGGDSVPEHAPGLVPRASRFHISHDMLVVGGRVIKWIVLGRAQYSRAYVHCLYTSTPTPLVPDFERMLKDYRRDWEKRQKRGEVNLPYNSGMYKLKRFQVGYRQIIDGEEIPELLLEFGPTDYFTQIITDLNVENPIRRRYAAATDITEQPVPEFASIVGVNLNLVTSDQLLIVTRRSRYAFVAGGSLHTSVGENLLRPKDALPDGMPDPFYTAARGAMEEVGIELKPEAIAFSAFGVEPQLCQYSLLGTVWLQQTGAEIEDLRKKGIPKDKWESRQLYFVPFDLGNVAQFVCDHWDSWFPTALAAVVMSLLDAGYTSEDIDAAFRYAGADQAFSTAPFHY